MGWFYAKTAVPLRVDVYLRTTRLGTEVLISYHVTDSDQTTMATVLKDKIWPAREVQTSTNVPGPIKIIMDWVCSYVMKPHPNLGRPGVVCPYVPPAMKLNSVWLAMVHTDLAAEADLCSIVEKYLR